MSLGKRSLSTLLSCCFVALSPSSSIAAPVEFRVLGGGLTLTTSPGSNTVTDVHGFFGVPGRALRIDAFHLSPSAPGSAGDGGHVDFAAGLMDFAVDYNVDCDLRDAQTGILVGTDSVSGVFTESGAFDPVTGRALLDGGSPPGRTNGHTTAGVLAIRIPDWIKELVSGRTLLVMPNPEEFLAGNATSLVYFGDTQGVGEMNLLASSDFGGGIVVAICSGSLQVQAVPAPAVGMFLIAPAILSIRRRR